MIKIMNLRPLAQSLNLLFPMRAYSDLPKLKREMDKRIAVQSIYPNLTTQYWSEKSALKKRRKQERLGGVINTGPDFLRSLQNLRNFPSTLKEIYEFIVHRRNRRNLMDQKFCLERELVLKPDLAAAHFILMRGGSVKFLGHSDWVGIKEKVQAVPFTYVPGYHIEAIKATGTRLLYEGLENLRKLKYISYLSLKDVEGVNDWYLDWISKEYYSSLKHLDLSNCIDVTYRGLSCFYRFECLKTLVMEGVPDTPELKLACLMLLEFNPDLEITGIDLGIPDKIDPVNTENTKLIQEETRQISEEAKQIPEGTKCISEKSQQVSKM